MMIVIQSRTTTRSRLKGERRCKVEEGDFVVMMMMVTGSVVNVASINQEQSRAKEDNLVEEESE
jgi:hypothetical protein